MIDSPRRTQTPDLSGRTDAQLHKRSGNVFPVLIKGIKMRNLLSTVDPPYITVASDCDLR